MNKGVAGWIHSGTIDQSQWRGKAKFYGAGSPGCQIWGVTVCAGMVAELKQVTKFFGVESGRAQQVLGGVDLSLAAGETVAIVGSSGSGKSTLLNILGTLEQPTSGEVSLFGQSVRGVGEKELAHIRAQQIGFIFQMHHLLPQLTAFENVMVPTLVEGDKSKRSGYEKRALELLDRVGLADHAQKRPGQLSGGERQRVAVVRALLKSPQLLLADEPTGALDEANALALTDLLAELNRETGVTVVLVTHDLALAGKMQRVLRLHQGLLQDGRA
jgi:lipoprotein-releasing system ATP-binding protein